jgi:DNA-binding Lrp family transcriptional regulator
VTAFVTLEISQRFGHDPVRRAPQRHPEVLEAHTITGSGDLLCRIVARSNTDLQRVIDIGRVVRRDPPRLDDHRARRADPLPHAAAGALGGRARYPERVTLPEITRHNPLTRADRTSARIDLLPVA